MSLRAPLKSAAQLYSKALPGRHFSWAWYERMKAIGPYIQYLHKILSTLMKRSTPSLCKVGLTTVHESIFGKIPLGSKMSGLIWSYERYAIKVWHIKLCMQTGLFFCRVYKEVVKYLRRTSPTTVNSKGHPINEAYPKFPLYGSEIIERGYM